MKFEIELSQEEVEALGVGSAEEAIDLIHGFIADYSDIDKNDEDLEMVEDLEIALTKNEIATILGIGRIQDMSNEELRDRVYKLVEEYKIS